MTLSCDSCLSLGGSEAIIIDTVYGCRHNANDAAVLAYRAGIGSVADVLAAMRTGDEVFVAGQTVEFIARTKGTK